MSDNLTLEIAKQSARYLEGHPFPGLIGTAQSCLPHLSAIQPAPLVVYNLDSLSNDYAHSLSVLSNSGSSTTAEERTYQSNTANQLRHAVGSALQANPSLATL